MKRVYLMGPILGTEYKECNDWREHAIEELAKYDIQGISPLRHKDIVDKSGLMGDFGGGNMMTTPSGIVTRDRYDATHCELGLANLLGAKKISLGTMVEYGWLDMKRIPIITVMEKEGNPHDHAFIRELSGYRVETLEEGIYIARCILTL
ncbi:MAG: nucleoside 2-deoxyribosyltransferase [Candidatus Pacearchaeota archaeon]|nr:nucleoside 2-deoxyribosyltransferase [Candidatus Pacearchaeota archaeon]